MAGYIGSKASVVSSGAERKKTFTITGSTTSLTGLNYTVGKVHVFQNGVRLVDGTDYTATNGTTITLTVAAQSGDNVVVISQASFQVADLPAGTPSIDDNGNATAITIDSNENVMLGNTVANPASGFASQAGFGYTGSTGVVEIATTANAAPLEIGKNNANDGQLIALRKQGTVVGSIGTVGNQSYIHGAGTDVGIYFGSNNLYPYRSTGLNDATIDLGQSAKRFKDAYLSGGVYLGGTGSANKLDSYEEGTFTPVFSHGGSTTDLAASYNYQVGKYTRVGNLVTYIIDIDGNGINTSAPSAGFSSISGLPFVSSGAHSFPIATQRNTTALSCASTQVPRFWVNTNCQYLYVQFDTLHTGASASGGSWDSSGRINITGHYYTQ